MNHPLLTCIVPIYFSSIGYIILRGRRAHRSYQHSQTVLYTQKYDEHKLVDKYSTPHYNPFKPYRPN